MGRELGNLGSMEGVGGTGGKGMGRSMGGGEEWEMQMNRQQAQQDAVDIYQAWWAGVVIYKAGGRVVTDFPDAPI